MKTIKEGFLRKNLGLGKEALIKNWLDEHGIKKYTINDDLTIDADKVDLRQLGIDELPEYIKFNKVKGFFILAECPNLISLRGCPKKIDGNFNINYNQKLTSLDGFPEKITGNISCIFCGKQFNSSDIRSICNVRGKVFCIWM